MLALLLLLLGLLVKSEESNEYITTAVSSLAREAINVMQRKGTCQKCSQSTSVDILQWSKGSQSLQSTDDANVFSLDQENLFIVSHDLSESICDSHFMNYLQKISQTLNNIDILVISWSPISCFAGNLTRFTLHSFESICEQIQSLWEFKSQIKALLAEKVNIAQKVKEVTLILPGMSVYFHPDIELALKGKTSLKKKAVYLNPTDGAKFNYFHGHNMLVLLKRMRKSTDTSIQVLHTADVVSDSDSSLGAIDVFVNGGRLQVGCYTSLSNINGLGSALRCSADLGWTLYLNSLKMKYEMKKCKCWDHFRRGQCSQNTDNVMGHFVNAKTPGKFFLRTSKQGKLLKDTSEYLGHPQDFAYFNDEGCTGHGSRKLSSGGAKKLSNVRFILTCTLAPLLHFNTQKMM